MDADDRKIPSHEVTYARLRDMILFGHLAPGAPVTIQGLIGELGAGMTPVREAIRRLTAEGALLPQGNRRVAVPELSGALLDQVAFARLTIEPKLAELAAPRLTPAAIDRLEAIDGAVTRAIDTGNLPAYLAANHAFHFALYEAADAPVLLDLARSLWLRAGPSLRAVIDRYGRDVAPDLHREALAAMRVGNAMALADAIKRDIQQGVDHVRQALPKDIDPALDCAACRCKPFLSPLRAKRAQPARKIEYLEKEQGNGVCAFAKYASVGRVRW